MSSKISVPDIVQKKVNGEKITALAAYDFTFASILDKAGVDIILVGDSLGSLIQGHENTLSVTLDEVIYHTKAVAKGCKRALVVADMPFMSCEIGVKECLFSCGRVIKETGAQAVKIESGVERAETVHSVVQAGIPVMAHIGLKPQSYHIMGGYKIQGRTDSQIEKLLEDARAVQEAGAFCVVVEGVCSDTAAKVTQSLNIPTIGIGAGNECSGQILVSYDMLGLTYLEAKRYPKFVSCYANLAQQVLDAATNYCQDVRSGKFPKKENSY